MYSSSHEWVKIEGNVATLGITNYAQEQLGDITFIEMPHVGETFDKGDECAVIESVKAASDIYAPLSGEVTEINESLADAPETVNDDPYDAGWLFKLRCANAEEADELLSADEYEDTIADEEEDEDEDE